jgi:predicted ATPase/C4-dicarboxylate-specific signal transduction histidine kinase
VSGERNIKGVGLDRLSVSERSDARFRKIQRQNAGPNTSSTVLAIRERTSSSGCRRLIHEFELAEYLDSSWALRPVELVQEHDQTILMFEDLGGELLPLPDGPVGIEEFLNLAIGISATVSEMHQRGLVHKDIKPANIITNSRDRKIRLTGFGIASRVPRERLPPEPPQFIAGTLAYMAPEQTGRMNRSVDSRSDLYALGVTFYQMLTGSLPFDAVDALEWIHCHIARQPASPTSRVPSVPLAISSIIAKLLAKAAEDRYQTAAGLTHDLRRCLADWEALKRVDPFSLGDHDISGRLIIPEKLYGRERDIGSLLAAFDGVVANGKPELVLVSGYSGIGKSAVVNELHKVLVLPRGLFASGKFDQYKRDIPYATLAQAFQNILHQLLSLPEAELIKWRDDLVHALGPNGLLITDLIPELSLIIGEQASVPEVSPQDAKIRFLMVFRRFIGVFARSEHPLALFLDDLQWLDAATLDLIENLLTQPDVHHLLLIAAYRDNEVGPDHPLMRKLEAIRQSGAACRHIVLNPLGTEDLTQLVTDSFHCGADRANLLARLLFGKTAGNPFFVIQFIATLVDEGLVTFDHADARWFWDLNQIDAKGYTDNVVELLVGRLNRLPTETQEALQQLACLGNSADMASLSIVRGIPEEEIHADLWEARRAELVERLDGAYKFAHDRIQEAAYSLIPKERLAEDHLRIGRLLLAHMPQDNREEALFEIVSHYDRGSARVTAEEEREQIAGLYLAAGKRARSSTAYSSALKYFIAGEELIVDDGWLRRRDLSFQLGLHRAECEFLTGDNDSADRRLIMLSSHALTAVEQSAVVCLQVDLYLTLHSPDRSIAVYLDYLQKQGVNWSSSSTSVELQREYDEVWSRLEGRTIEDLIELQPMNNPVALATLDVLVKAIAPTLLSDANLTGLIACRMTNLSLQYGNGDGSGFGYIWFGIIARALFGNHHEGVRFGRLGLQLIEKRDLQRFQGRAYRAFGENLSIWTDHIGIGCDLLRQGIEAAKKIGDVAYLAYSIETLGRLLLASGRPLDEVQRETERGLEFARGARLEFISYVMTPRLALIRTLRGLTSKFNTLDSEQFSECVFEQRLATGEQKLFDRALYCIRKLQARFYAGEYAAALDALSGIEPMLSMAVQYVEVAEYHFYAALCHSSRVGFGDAEGRDRHMEALTAHQRKLLIWATQCSSNFEHRAALVGAEIARIEGRTLEAERLYERAIQSAHTNGFINSEAIGNELAARFHASRGLEIIANAYLREALSCYRRWGADGKVRQMEGLHPHLREAEPTQAAVATITAGSEQLDLATVIKVSQVLSGEMVLEKLIDTLMHLATEHAGAERGVLLLARSNELRQAAEAITGGNSIVVRRLDERAAELPDTIIQYVVRAREAVILDDASLHPTHSTDRFVIGRGTKSVMCLPLVNESKIVGVLYLENNLASGVFTSDRILVLKLLASQAAISLKNAYLYDDLARAEEARDKTRSELAHVNRVASLGALSASIAHEIKQPLASIVTNGETGLRWLLRDEPNLAKVEVLMKRVVDDARRAAGIIDRIRNMASRGSIKKSVFALGDVVSESAAFLEHEFEDNGVLVFLDLAPDLPTVFGDRTQLQQVIVNLAMNAVQAMIKSGVTNRSLAIRTGKIDVGTVYCIVEDSGPGIDVAHLPRLFDSFFTTKETGMGLGLPITQSIIETHNGHIRADNESSLGGARFAFELPVSSHLNS